MSNKSKRRARARAEASGLSYQAAMNLQRRHLAEQREQSRRVVGERLAAALQHQRASIVRDLAPRELAELCGAAISDPSSQPFDFVVADEESSRPLFAVGVGEISETARLQPARVLCARLDLPLAIIGHAHLDVRYRGEECVGWLVNLFFADEALQQAQEEGMIPWDEPVDALSAWTTGAPVSLARQVMNAVHRASDSKLIHANVPFHVTVRGPSFGAALVSLKVGDDRFLVATERIGIQGFGSSDTEIAEELAMARLGSLLERYLGGDDATVSAEVVYAHAEAIAGVGQAGSFGGRSGDPDDFGLRGQLAGGRLEASITPPRRLTVKPLRLGPRI